MRNPKEDLYLEPPLGTQAILTRLDKGERPPEKWRTEHVRKGILWEHVRRTDVSVEEKELDDKMVELQTYWGSHHDALYMFRGGIIGRLYSARIIGFQPGNYVDQEGNRTGRRFLRLYLECDPELLKELDPPPQLV